jgi:hypothetical protein
MMNEGEKSDPSKVAKRPANKPNVSEVDLWDGGAESAEPRGGTEGNTGEQHTCRTPSRENVSQGLERVREAAKQRKKERFNFQDTPPVPLLLSRLTIAAPDGKNACGMSKLRVSVFLSAVTMPFDSSDLTDENGLRVKARKPFNRREIRLAFKFVSARGRRRRSDPP